MENEGEKLYSFLYIFFLYISCVNFLFELSLLDSIVLFRRKEASLAKVINVNRSIVDGASKLVASLLVYSLWGTVGCGSDHPLSTREKKKRKKRLVKRGRRIFRFDYVRVALTRLRVLIAPYPKQENSTSPPLYIRQLYYNCPITRAYNSFRFAFASQVGEKRSRRDFPFRREIDARLFKYKSSLPSSFQEWKGNGKMYQSGLRLSRRQKFHISHRHGNNLACFALGLA